MSDSPQTAFAEALAKFQAELPHVGKGQTANTGSYSYTYADLSDIHEAVLPQMTRHGLSFTCAPAMTEQGFVLRFALLHTGGHREEGAYPLPDPNRASPQQIGSAITYGRRYCFCAVTGVAPDEDDDGQHAADTRARTAPREPERVTDVGWIEDFRHRLLLADRPSVIRGLREEATVVWGEGRLTAADAKALKREMDERDAELKPLEVPS